MSLNGVFGLAWFGIGRLDFWLWILLETIKNRSKTNFWSLWLFPLRIIIILKVTILWKVNSVKKLLFYTVILFLYFKPTCLDLFFWIYHFPICFHDSVKNIFIIKFFFFNIIQSGTYLFFIQGIQIGSKFFLWSQTKPYQVQISGAI